MSCSGKNTKDIIENPPPKFTGGGFIKLYYFSNILKKHGNMGICRGKIQVKSWKNKEN